MLIGYSRISTNDQSLNSQIDKLKQYGCKEIYTDVISGSKANRPQLDKMLEFIREGDTVVVYRLDRLGRGLKDLINLINTFQEKKVNFKSLTENIDTTTPGGMLIFHIFGAVAEFERNLIRERTNAGLESARARGKKGGRKTKITEEKIKMAKLLHNDKSMDIDAIAKQLGVCRTTFYEMLKN
jgi:DNA invertase Pin-like site-specific DNA recombinase